MNEEKEVRNHNRMTMEKTWKVGQWLHSIHEKLQQETPSYMTVAKWATNELGFVVTDLQVRGVAKIVNVSWPRTERHPGPVDYRAKLSKLEHEMNDLLPYVTKISGELATATAQISVLRRVIHEIMDQMGVKEIAGYRVPKSDIPVVANRLHDSKSNPPSFA